MGKKGKKYRKDYDELREKETLYNNDITNLEEYIDIVKDWLLFYNTKRIKNRDYINCSLWIKELSFFSVHYAGVTSN